jgi:hypothetical protein
MDDPYVGPKPLIRLQRACERNRLEKQFLIDAYEHLVMLVVPEERHGVSGDAVATEGGWSPEHANAREACGVGND